MTHQFFKRRHQSLKSLKEIELHGAYTCSPTWDDAVRHWYGFAEPMVRSEIYGDDGMETEPPWIEVEGEPIWNTNGEWPDDGLYDGGRGIPNFIPSSEGHSISPTRTPWAVWWRPNGWIRHSHDDSPVYFWLPLKEEKYELPDIQKENPQ